MPQANITIRFAVGMGHRPGDYAQIFSNNGSGDVDYTVPFDARRIELMPNGAGWYGFGHGPFGHHPFGKPFGRNIHRGFGHLPFGHHPFGYGGVLIEETVSVTDCGAWTFALVAYDKLGNAHEGTPNTSTVTVHVAPPKAGPLVKDSYDPDTDILTLTVPDPRGPNRLGALPPRRWPGLGGGPYADFTSRIDGPTADTGGAVDPGLPERGV